MLIMIMVMLIEHQAEQKSIFLHVPSGNMAMYTDNYILNKNTCFGPIK